MPNGIDRRVLAAAVRSRLTLANAARAAGSPLLFGFRLWASVCLALFIAFWLELDNPYWAGISAAIVCQPYLGASLRKSRYRIVGTLVGAASPRCNHIRVPHRAAKHDGNPNRNKRHERRNKSSVRS
jgi:hypothetical protein